MIPEKYKSEPLNSNLAFRAPDSLKKKIKEYAKKEKVSMSAIITWALEILFEQIESKKENETR